MSFVLDCSVAISWVFPDESTESTDQLRESLVVGRAFVPPTGMRHPQQPPQA